MHIRVKLMASLRNKLPPGSAGGATELDIGPGSPITAVLDRLGIPVGHVHLVLVNGAMEPDRGRALVEGDELTIFPPVAGG